MSAIPPHETLPPQPPGGDVRVRGMTRADLDTILGLERLCFPGIPDERAWKPDQLTAHVSVFPAGQFVAELDGDIVGSCTNLLTTWEAAMRPHTWHEITGRGRLLTHDPEGDVLYGTEVMVHPDVRRRGIGRRLFEARFGYVTRHGLRAFVTGGRLPGYVAHAQQLTPQEYVARVTRGALTDPVLTPDLKWGMSPVGVLCGYLTDPASLHHAALLVWRNPEAGPARQNG